ncbi:hypothetical protein [uncultured Polaribacter sp.]|uniref:hypothetical protein n=1 Tax=uncultured Polaribacter sp. TaxID=174711 RepID=UPI002627EBE7|nr:hypothetical protein [uncultured Polaribacter sp.]
MKNQLKNNWKLFLLASFTLGLAPFNPPHILGKIKWILGGNAFFGANAMQLKDWFDVLLHGTPWLLLVISVVLKLYDLKINRNTTS